MSEEKILTEKAKNFLTLIGLGNAKFHSFYDLPEREIRFTTALSLKTLNQTLEASFPKLSNPLSGISEYLVFENGGKLTGRLVGKIVVNPYCDLNLNTIKLVDIYGFVNYRND